MRKVLGLGIDAHSIDRAFIEQELSNSIRKKTLGVRIIPIDSELLSKYESVQAASKMRFEGRLNTTQIKWDFHQYPISALRPF